MSRRARRLSDRFLHGKALPDRRPLTRRCGGSSNSPTPAGHQPGAEPRELCAPCGQRGAGMVRRVWTRPIPTTSPPCSRPDSKPHSPQLVYLADALGAIRRELQAEPRLRAHLRFTTRRSNRTGCGAGAPHLDERMAFWSRTEVGLGKTFLAGELIREAAVDRRQKVLVITPATCADGPCAHLRASTTLRWNLCRSRS